MSFKVVELLKACQQLLLR